MQRGKHHNLVTRAVLVAVFCGVVASVHAQNPATPSPAGSSSTAKVDYEDDVRPILTSRCFSCHGPKQAQSGLRLDLRQNALRGGDYGVVIVPGKAAESKLIQRLIGSSAGLQMPPTGELPINEVETLRAWIEQGAEMPGNAFETAIERPPTAPAVQAFLDQIERRDLAAVRKSLAANRDLARAADGAGSTALMHSASVGTVAIMRELLEAGADVNAPNVRKATALHWALPDPEKVKLLLVKGARANEKTVEGRTPLYIAASLPAGAPAVRLLLEVGANVDEPTIPGTTALFPAATTSAEIVKLLLDKGANPNARAKTDATPLMFTRGADVIALLLARGADVRARSKTGETALMETAIRGDAAASKLLLDNGADVNAADHRGYTPLLLAAQHDGDAVELVRLLLSRGANPNATAEGETALSLAAKRGETEVTDLLREAAAAARTSGLR
jgi:ankyrin repeat protein